MLDVVPHPHHEGLKDGLLVGDVDVIAGQQFNNLRRGEQQELLVLNDLQKVFLEDRGDVEEADNHQSLAGGRVGRGIGSALCVCVCMFRHQQHKDRVVTKESDASRQKTHSDGAVSAVSHEQHSKTLISFVSMFFRKQMKPSVCFPVAR